MGQPFRAHSYLWGLAPWNYFALAPRFQPSCFGLFLLFIRFRKQHAQDTCSCCQLWDCSLPAKSVHRRRQGELDGIPKVLRGGVELGETPNITKWSRSLSTLRLSLELHRASLRKAFEEVTWQYELSQRD